MTNAKISRPVCILGLGLIGGSLLRDLSAAGVEVFGFNRSPSGATAAAKEGYDVTSDFIPTLQRAEATGALIVMATPMPAIASLLSAIAEHAPSCGITDVVSVKAEVYKQVCEAGMQDRYVGSHPMAGTADSGWPASMTGLFKKAAWVVTFDHAYDSPSDSWVELWLDVVQMALLVGAEVIPARVTAHDQAVARISHLPHIFAEVLAITGDNGGALALSLAAGSFRDSTRVAGSTPSLVQAMCETNHEALLLALDEALALLSDARAHLASPEDDLGMLIDAGYRSRIRFEARSASSAITGISGRPVLRLHPGAKGWISQLEQAENLGARIEVF
ncbi:prephenate dehydrogenase [Corynebacterium sp. H128]|uniref:prephenate dehydrogenase n=1 Tax=unclassified Corynebacterium TaxID=2624378 RepID=UPI0030B67365